ncbi:MAG TPA: alpha-amylase family glycosyl hydrolase, partial [Spirochaetota bacterium]|nr:alpha-amylase family glycosyl hydrolase [Spirochaetota bacterium]
MRKIFTAILLIITILSCKTNSNSKENISVKINEISPNNENSLKLEKDWYKDAFFYHIWVRAFNDSNNDGFGDIKGIIEKLDYLNDGNPETKNDLGIDAIWLSPIFESFGKGTSIHAYDTIDHYKINEKFGTNDDLELLLKEAHKRRIKVVFDFIPNHISAFHPWFLNAIDEGDKKDWFIWSKNPDKNYGLAWGGGKWSDVWHKVIKNKSYFYGCFHRSMPDINSENQNAKNAINNVLIYWLNKGFDGARIDAARYIYEDGP